MDFWTYTCINCIRTLPYLKAWDAAYRKDGLTVVGVETPEFAFEHEASNVKDAIDQFGLRYPVVQDNEMGTWNAYGNEYWPADYLIDAQRRRALCDCRRGRLLADRDRDQGAARRSGRDRRRDEPPDGRGDAQRSGDAGDVSRHQPCAGMAQRAKVRAARLRRERARRIWRSTNSTTAAHGTSPHSPRRRCQSASGIDMEFEAKNVYLVLSSEGEQPAPGAGAAGRQADTQQACAGADVHNGALTVTERAPVLARVAARRSTAPPVAALCSRRVWLRVHVRLVGPGSSASGIQ